MCDAAFDAATAERTCQWMGFDTHASFQTEQAIPGDSPSFPLGALQCDASASVPEDCNMQTSTATHGATQSGVNGATASCEMPDDVTSGPVPSSCGASSGIRLTCRTDYVASMMSETGTGEPDPVSMPTGFQKGLALVHSKKLPRSRVCVSETVLGTSGGKQIGDAFCRSAGFVRAFAGSVRAGEGDAAAMSTIRSAFEVQSCHENAAALENCQLSFFQHSDASWRLPGGDSCESRGLK